MFFVYDKNKDGVIFLVLLLEYFGFCLNNKVLEFRVVGKFCEVSGWYDIIDICKMYVLVFEIKFK